MRTKTMRNVLLWIAGIFLFVVLAGICLVESMQKKSARAAEAEVWQTGVFEMNDGVSLRFSDENGLRFIVKMDEDVANFVTTTEEAEMGFIIAPESLMLKANGDYINMAQKIGGAIDKNKIYQEGDYYQANACITGVKYNNFELDFVAVAYIQYGGEIRYTEYNNKAKLNMYDLVNMAFLNGYAEAIQEFSYLKVSDEIGWYGSDKFPIVVENTDEYNALVEVVNKTEIDLENNYVVVENNATPSESFTDETPIIMSAAVDRINKLIENLPDSVTMPDAIGQIGRIRDAEEQYEELSAAEKLEVENYAKVETLLELIHGYDRVYKNDATDGTVIPSYVPGGFSSTIGGSATTRTDDLYGNVLTVTSDADGRAQLYFENFPSVTKYAKIYFYVKVDVGCDLYISDGITHDGWGENWKNTWSTSGFWCNANTWKLVELYVADGYIGTNFAIGFRTDTTGFTFEISDIYGIVKEKVKMPASLAFGEMTDTGTTNEYGKVYNLATQWGGDTDFQSFEVNALSSALTTGHDSFYFWIYNPNANDVTMELVNTVSWKHYDVTTLTAGAWTKYTISAEAIEANKTGGTVCCVSSGASTAGWQMSAIFKGPEPVQAEIVYLDHADVKNVIALINAIPEFLTMNDVATIEKARAAYDNLSSSQQALVTNVAKLTNAETFIVENEKASEVIAMIDAINPRAVEKSAVEAARAAYDNLTDTAKTYVTNIATLEEYEAQLSEESEVQAAANSVISKITALPDEVVMPDHLVFVSRIEAARDAYNALSDEGKELVTNYAKLRTLVSAIRGYETVHVQTLDGVNVVPSHVPNYTSTIGGTASMGYDGYYGDYLRVTPNAGGKVAIQFKNFPDVSEYSKIYFNIRVVGESCDLYLSDGITNDGWGDNWHNTWSTSGLWANNGNWIQKELAVSTGIFSSNWALGLRTDPTDVSFEITNIVGVKLDLGEKTNTSFGNISDTGTKNEYGTVYNFTQGWSSNTDLGAFNIGILKAALNEGHDSLRFYIYNPQQDDVGFYFNENETWIQTEVATLTTQAWTEVIITPELITANETYLLYVCVRSGASTSGWQISPIYSFSSGDLIAQVQARIDTLNENSSKAAIDAARQAYEELPETEKLLVNIEKLITRETALYGDMAENAPFIVNGGTSYKILYNAEAKEAATFLQEQIEAITGVNVELVSINPSAVDKYRYAIMFCDRTLATDVIGTGANITAWSGYAIRRPARAVFIEANSADGYRMAALAFLREMYGYDMISEDCVVYGDRLDSFPAFDLVENPSFDYRQQQTYMTEDEVLGMGLQSHTDIWVHSNQGWDMHNALHYLPVATYGTSHSNWYTSDKTQICPTAGGNSAEFAAMVDAIVANMMVQINAQPNKENISFSIMDSVGGDDCTCARCTLYDTLYGEGGFSAAWIDLMNAINAKIQAQIGDRKLNIAFLAYRSTENAPASINANGEVTLMKRYQINDDGSYTQTNENLKCDDGVMVWLAPIEGKYAENFNHTDNADTLALIKKWCALSDNVYLWMYGTNFKNYLYPYNTWQASAENYKILAELGVKGAWSQSNETEATAFSDLKAYIDSKFMFNANADYETVLDTYFTNYFGAGAEKMRSMFDAIVAKCEEIEANYDGLGRGIYDEIENVNGFMGIGSKTYWSKDWLNSLVTLCDEAKALVDADTNLTEEQKTAIKNRITKESLFPRYVLCTSFASSYSNSNKKAMRQAFKADATALGLTLYKEANGLLSDLYDDWGV
ncbi:MAG: DUF4838 domain-containing protein [Clostridia bacterium]|nr:DUF4838 domain-containing protein [Clostridia bacterium]